MFFNPVRFPEWEAERARDGSSAPDKVAPVSGGEGGEVAGWPRSLQGLDGRFGASSTLSAGGRGGGDWRSLPWTC